MESSKGTQITVAMNDQSQSRLMGLPAEIRNRIYYACLVGDGEVVTTEDLKPPSLLATCRQIRKEAIQIYYLTNEFIIDVRDCNKTTYETYYRTVISPVGEHMSEQWDLWIRRRGVNWTNLMDWSRAVWQDELPRPEVMDDCDDDWTVIAAATNIAYESRTLAWEVVEKQLKALRAVASRVDDRWLE